jgi:hypothetical protein
MKLDILLSFWLLILSCNSQKDTTINSKNNPVSTQENENFASSFIEMKKTACRGKCPVYTLKVTGNGIVELVGKQNLDKIGNYNKTLSKDETSKLFQSFADADFWKFKDEYVSKITDLPTTFLTFSHGGKIKAIKDYHGAPVELKSLEKKLEDIVSSNDGWKKQE